MPYIFSKVAVYLKIIIKNHQQGFVERVNKWPVKQAVIKSSGKKFLKTGNKIKEKNNCNI